MLLALYRLFGVNFRGGRVESTDAASPFFPGSPVRAGLAENGQPEASLEQSPLEAVMLKASSDPELVARTLESWLSNDKPLKP